jgi:polygalacturonase
MNIAVRNLLSIPVAMLLLSSCSTPPSTGTPAPTTTAARSETPSGYNVRSFGATGDGKTLDTAAINKAIDAAAAAGGGTVEFPAGTYLTYSIHLKSHVTLHLDAGSTIEAAIPAADLSAGYDAPEPNPVIDQYEDFGHSHWHNSLIWGEDLEDIGIVGPGRIFGRGLSRGNQVLFDLAPGEKSLPEDQRPKNGLPAAAKAELAKIKPGPFSYPGPKDSLPAGIGNKAIALKNCHNVIFRDFTIFHGGHFGILATGVDNWTCDNLKIDTNRDGIDFDCCQNVRVSNCTVNTPNDDGICPKSSYALGKNRATENVTITNCMVCGYDEGTMLDRTCKRRDPHVFGGGPTGRIKCGTEGNGGFRNITISNCVFEYCRGLAFESVDGALMEDIAVTNITMREIVNAPIFIRLGARLRGPDGTKVGTAKRIKISNIVAHDVYTIPEAGDHGSGEAGRPPQGILIAGLASNPIEDVELSNIFIEYNGGGTKAQGDRVVPESEKEYPEPGRFGVLPAAALWARHVKNFDVHHVEFQFVKDDLRPTIVLDDVTDVTIEHAKLHKAADAPVLALKNVTGLTIRTSPGLADTVRTDKIADEKL